jgi:hypothetical protein
MSDATTTLKVFGMPLRRGLHAPGEMVIDQAVIHVPEDVQTQHRIWRHGGMDWNITTSCPAPGWEGVLIDEHNIFPGAHSYTTQLARYTIAATALVTMGVFLCGWPSFTKGIKWLSLFKPNLDTEHALFGVPAFEGVGELALTKVGEVTWSHGGPDVAELTQYLLTSSKLTYTRELAARVQELEQDLLDEGDGETLSPTSLFGLVRFLETTANVRHPELAAGRGGHLIARWVGPDGREIRIHFRVDGGTQLYAFVPDQAQADKTEVLSASPSTDALAMRLRQLEILPWMTE